jgi:ankyrin repeat protein
MQLLLERGADVQHPECSLTPSSREGEIAATQVFLEYGSIVHVRNHIGWIQLHYAPSESYQYPDIIELLLLGNRTDVDVQDNRHTTPLHLE